MKTKLAIGALAALCCLVWATEEAVSSHNTAVKAENPIIGSRESAIGDGVDAITIPRLLSYQGKLTDNLGNPVADTVYAVRFRLYAQAAGGAHFWEENQQVRTKAGLFSVLLGSVTLIDSVPQAGGCFLGIKVGSDAEMTPLTRVASSAYAFLARRADTANYAVTGGTSGDYAWVRGTPDSVLFTIRRLGVARGGAGNALEGTDVQTQTNFGVSCTTGDAYAAVGGGLGNVASGSRATVGGGWNNTAGGASAVVAGGWSNAASGDRSVAAGGYSNSATADYAAVVGGSYNVASGDFSIVGGGRADTARAYASAVLSGYHNIAGDGATDSGATVAGGRNNRALARYAVVGGGYDNLASGEYATVAGGWQNSASLRYATVGGGSDNAATDTCATVAGGQDNTAAANFSTIAGGVENYAGIQGAIPGGYQDTVLGTNGFAAGWHSKVGSTHLNAAAFTGSHTTASVQVRAQSFSTGTGMFTIDHPQDPLNRILNQYAVGASEQILSYRGVAIIGPDGRVAVSLPTYFDALNRNPMVQLTGIGTSDVYVAEEVSGNRFAIGGKPGTKVFWTVTGERKDLAADMARVFTPVEQEKTGDLSGHSLDDDALAGYMAGLERLGLGGNYSFRTADGRRQYEMVAGAVRVQDSKPREPQRTEPGRSREDRLTPTLNHKRGLNE